MASEYLVSGMDYKVVQAIQRSRSNSAWIQRVFQTVRDDPCSKGRHGGSCRRRDSKSLKRVKAGLGKQGGKEVGMRKCHVHLDESGRKWTVPSERLPRLDGFDVRCDLAAELRSSLTPHLRHALYLGLRSPSWYREIPLPFPQKTLQIYICDIIDPYNALATRTKGTEMR